MCLAWPSPASHDLPDQEWRERDGEGKGLAMEGRKDDSSVGSESSEAGLIDGSGGG